MDCDFSNSELKCSRCGFAIGKLGGNATWRKNCTAPINVGDCQHLGAEMRRVVCQTCDDKGQFKIKIMACEIFGECTLGQQIEALPVCSTCQSFTPSSQSPSGNGVVKLAKFLS